MFNVQAFLTRRFQLAIDRGRILLYLMACIAGLAVGCAVLIRLVDPHDFPTIGLALWWAVMTVTTVGYGDIVPTTTAGRFVASALMIVGFASLSLLTGFVASLLVHRRAAADAASAVTGIERRLDEIERLLRKDAA
ncbi:MAG TPA: potassium channel family protein [Gaiellaceae bacterium]|nr:potassium channel family protein [Gaiellaceae bacterium]